MTDVHRFLERSRLPILVIVLIPIISVLYLVFGANENSTAPAAPAQATSVQTTPSTLPAANISLNDPSSLPRSVAAAQLVPFSFTVQNVSGQSVSYQYKVSVRWSTGESDVIDENTISLDAGASTQVQEQLKFEIATETAGVLFELPQTGQDLQFAIPRTQ